MLHSVRCDDVDQVPHLHFTAVKPCCSSKANQNVVGLGQPCFITHIKCHVTLKGLNYSDTSDGALTNHMHGSVQTHARATSVDEDLMIYTLYLLWPH